MIVQDMLDLLCGVSPDTILRFSVAIDEKDNPDERWFVEDNIEDWFADADEITICLVGKSNLK